MRLAIAAASLVLLTSSVAFGQEIPTCRPEQVGLSRDKLATAGKAIQKLVDDDLIEGMVVLVARHGKVAFHEAYGSANVSTSQPMTPDTIFRIYSMTKPVTSVATLILCERGKVDLDEPISTYLPEFRGVRLRNGAAPSRSPTVRDLLRHTSGHSNPYFAHPLAEDYDKAHRGNESLANNVKRYAEIPLLYEPGTKFSYGFALDIAARIVETASGERFDRFVQKEIFNPLDMKDTGYYVPREKLHRLAAMHTRAGGKLTVTEAFDRSYDKPPTFTGGGLGLVTTARDYVRFCQMLLNGGTLFDKTILSKASVDEMTRNQLPNPDLRFGLPPGREKYRNVYVSDEAQVLDDTGYGLGVAVTLTSSGVADRKGDYWHGGAATTGFSISPELEMIVIKFRQSIPNDGADAKIREMIFSAIK